ncbi:MAG: SOS response-associated peptidase [Pseudomonadota bacterium]
MCGRFALTLPKKAMANLFDAEILTDFGGPKYNVTPTSQIPVCVMFEGKRVITSMRWGFIPHWYASPSDGPLLINARSETVTQKPAFGTAFRRRRCLIPASGFFEWHREKDRPKEPYYITRTDGAEMVFAGIWQAWTGKDGERRITCAILTKPASVPIEAIHHREPVTVATTEFKNWLSLSPDTTEVFSPSAPGSFKMHRVDPKVNSARVDTPDLIEEVQTNT